MWEYEISLGLNSIFLLICAVELILGISVIILLKGGPPTACFVVREDRTAHA